MKKSLVPALLIAPLLCGIATAADNGITIGAALGQSEQALRESSINLKDEALGFKAFVGVRPIDLLAVELNYIDFGSASNAGTEADTRAAALFLIGYLPLPLPLLDVYGKAGAAAWKVAARHRVASGGGLCSSFAWGAGAALRCGSFGVRLEYENFNDSGNRNLELLSLGVTYTFL